MQRDRLLLTEIIDAAERIIDLAAARSADDFVADRDRRDALLWNYTVLGEAIGQLSDEMKSAHPRLFAEEQPVTSARPQSGPRTAWDYRVHLPRSPIGR